MVLERPSRNCNHVRLVLDSADLCTYNFGRTPERAITMDQRDRKPAATAKETGPSDGVSQSGVDRTLIQWMLSLSPSERIEFVQRHVNAVQELKERSDST